MNCQESKKFMDAYVDGELEAGKMLEIDAHVGQCEQCSSIFQLTGDLKHQLSNLGQQRAPAHLVSQVESMGNSRFLMRRAYPVIASVAAAAVLLLAVWQVATPPPNQLDQVVTDVVDRHVQELPMEVNVPNQMEAASWFRGKTDFPVRPLGSHLKNASFKGARLSNVREQQAAQMTYLIDGKKVTLMVFPARGVAIQGGETVRRNGMNITTGRKNGYNVAITQRDDMLYTLSSELSSRRLIQLIASSDLTQDK